MRGTANLAVRKNAANYFAGTALGATRCKSCNAATSGEVPIRARIPCAAARAAESVVMQGT